MPTPSAVQSIHATDIITTFDIDKPERLAELFRIRGDQGLSYFAILKAMGFSLPVAQDTYGHNEEDWIHEVFHVRNLVPAPGAGNPAAITLELGDLDASNRFYPRLWDTVMFPNEVTGQITDIDTTTPTAPVVTVTPNLSTDDIGALPAGTELIIISDAFSEGSGQPESVTRGVFFYDNDTQIIKETFTATGSEMTNQKWFDKYQNGKGFYAYYIKGQEDTEYTMQLKIDGALLFQKRTDVGQINDPVTGRDLRTTEGWVPYIRRTGNIVPHTTGLFSVQKFNEMSKVLNREFAAKNVCCLFGFDLNTEVGDVLVDYFDDTNIEFAQKKMVASAFGGNEGLAAAVDFSYLVKSGFTYNFKTMEVFTHSKLYGATGYNMPNMGIVTPMGKKKDKLSKKDLPTFGCRYKKLGPYERMMEVWNVSGAGPAQKVIADDLHNHYMRCHIGAHFMAGNQMILVDPQ